MRVRKGMNDARHEQKQIRMQVVITRFLLSRFFLLLFAVIDNIREVP